eukprot:6476764-Amphidinium_carterae.1
MAYTLALDVVVVHLVRDHLHTWRQLAELAIHACSGCLHPLLLLGDMNVVYSEQDVVSDCGDPRPAHASIDGQWWSRQCSEWSLLTSLWTHRHVATRTLRSLDRIYCNADIQTLADLHPITVIHGKASIPPGGSDHWPVRLTWLSSRARSSKHGLPRYVTKHPQFSKLLQCELELIPGGICWTRMWEEFKVSLSVVAKRIEELPDIPTSSCHLRYAASLRCLRAWRQNRLAFRTMLNRCEGWTHVAAMVDDCALRWLRDDCKAARSEMLQEEIKAEPTDTQTNKADFLIKMLHHWRRHQWAGQPGVTDCTTVGDELWRNIGLQHFKTCRKSTKLTGMTTWSMHPSLIGQHFDSLASAPGPDGVTYAMVAASGMWGVRLLLTALAAILHGAALPEAWSDSHLIFLPKGQASKLDVDQWRPLCLANVCFKILQGIATSHKHWVSWNMVPCMSRDRIRTLPFSFVISAMYLVAFTEGSCVLYSPPWPSPRQY